MPPTRTEDASFSTSMFEEELFFSPSMSTLAVVWARRKEGEGSPPFFFSQFRFLRLALSAAGKNKKFNHQMQNPSPC